MDGAFFFADWLGKPVWLWLAFLGIVAALLVLDLGVLHRESREIGVRESLLLSAGYIGLGSLFGGWVWWYSGPEPGMAYLTAFAVEKALAMDNVFVIAMIFAYFAVPRYLQHPRGDVCRPGVARQTSPDRGRAVSPVPRREGGASGRLLQDFARVPGHARLGRRVTPVRAGLGQSHPRQALQARFVLLRAGSAGGAAQHQAVQGGAAARLQIGLVPHGP